MNGRWLRAAGAGISSGRERNSLKVNRPLTANFGHSSERLNSVE